MREEVKKTYINEQNQASLFESIVKSDEIMIPNNIDSNSFPKNVHPVAERISASEIKDSQSFIDQPIFENINGLSVERDKKIIREETFLCKHYIEPKQVIINYFS